MSKWEIHQPVTALIGSTNVQWGEEADEVRDVVPQRLYEHILCVNPPLNEGSLYNTRMST